MRAVFPITARFRLSKWDCAGLRSDHDHSGADDESCVHQSGSGFTLWFISISCRDWYYPVSDPAGRQRTNPEPISEGSRDIGQDLVQRVSTSDFK